MGGGFKEKMKKMDEKVQRLNYIDIKLIKWATVCATIIIVKFFPQILIIDYWILIVLMIAASIRPARKFLGK
ncbi:MAG: hypothetical protein KAS92_02260 [Candidatus Omnitrophica bacterium]|nr:hypothetical protein [Candidatus Omnitrophota bacterium]